MYGGHRIVIVGVGERQEGINKTDRVRQVAK